MHSAIPGAREAPPCASCSSIPRTLLLARYDVDGNLAYVGRTATLPAAAGNTLASLPSPPMAGHPWEGWSFSAGWGTSKALDVTLVEPDVVVEVGADIARDSTGRWRHPARWHRIRTDLSPAEITHKDPLISAPSASVPSPDVQRVRF